MKKILVLLFGIFFLLLPASGFAPNVTQCAVLSDNNTVYNLTTNFTNTTASTCINITGFNDTFDCQGYTMTGNSSSGYGIEINWASGTNTNNTIKNCSLTSWYNGIYINYAYNNTITNNTVRDIGLYGMQISYSTANNLTKNNVSNATFDIYFRYSYNNNLTNNTLNNSVIDIYFDSGSYGNILINNSINHTLNQQGLFVYGGSSNISDIRNNISESNTINGKPIYYIDGVSRLCVNNTNYTNGSSYGYMAFVGCNNINISSSSPLDGVMLAGTTNSYISGLNVSYVQYPLWMPDGTNGNRIINNTFNNNSYGIWLWTNSSNNNITNNTVKNNAYNGIYLSSSSDNNTIVNNILSNNNYGVYIYSSSNNTITNGSIASSTNYDYFFDTIGSTNNFTNTNFTASRKIWFSGTTDWFNYANTTTSLWLRTNNIANNHALTRTLNNWNQTNVSWNDSDSSTDTANYTIYGLIANTLYAVSNNSVNLTAINSSSCGCINFTIGLTTSSQIIQVFNITDATSPTWSANNSSIPTNYSSTLSQFNITWNDAISPISTVFITIMNSTNSSDIRVSNASMTSLGGGFYNYSIVLPVGTWNWTSYANDSANNWNASNNWTFTISKGILSGSISGISVTLPSTISITPSETNSGDANVNYTFYRDSTLVSLANGTSTLSADTTPSTAGTYTYKLNTTGETFANWSSNSSIYTISITVSAAASGSGSTSSGSSSSSSSSVYVVRAIGKANITSTSITTSGKMIATIAKFQDVAIRGMNITVVNTVANIKIMITKLSMLPSSISYDITGMAYHYINIEKINMTDSDIKNVNISFAVNKTWLTNNNIAYSNITLYRWANNRWNDLGAIKASEDSSEVFYTASSPGLSVFVIGTKGVQAAPPTGAVTTCVESWTCGEWSSCANDLQARTCTDSNNCGTTASKPSTSQSCQAQAAVTTPTQFSILSNVLFIVAAVIVCVVIFLERVKITSYFQRFSKKDQV